MADQVTVVQQEFSIGQLIKRTSWKTILIELIEKEKLDPWNIDIVDITTGFIKEVRKMKDLNLSVPANVILATSILLRFKSSSIKQGLGVFEQQTLVADDFMPSFGSLPEVAMASRFPPKRMVSLEELITMVDTVMEKVRARAGREAAKPQGFKIIELKIDGYDIEKEMEKTLVLMNGLKDGDGMLLFSALAKRISEVEAFLPLLYLRMHKKITLMQEDFFGEIVIYMKDGSAPDLTFDAKIVHTE